MNKKVIVPILCLVFVLVAAKVYANLTLGTTSVASNGALTLSTSSSTLVLPTTNGTNGQVLTTNGSGVTSWSTVLGGGGCTATVTMPILLSSTTVDLNEGTGAKQPLYTCPLNRKCFITGYIVHQFSVIGDGNGFSRSGWNVTSNDVLSEAALDNPAPVSMYNLLINTSQWAGTFYAIGNAGDVLGWKVTTPDGDPLTAKVDVFGYLTDTSGVPVANVCGPQ